MIASSMSENHHSHLIGLSGTLGAGKDVYARHLANKYDFLHVSTGDLIREIALQKGLDIERPTLIELGSQLRREYRSYGALVIKAIEKWQDTTGESSRGLVVSGLRVVGEANEVIDRGGKLVFIDAPRSLRYARIIQRQRDCESSVSLEEFTSRDEAEFNGSTHDNARPNLSVIQKISHLVVSNTFADEIHFCEHVDRELNNLK